MKKQFIVITLSLFIITTLVFTAYAQQKENKGNKKEQQKQGKKQDTPDNKDKKDKKDNKGDKKDDNGKNNGKENNGRNDDKGNGNKHDMKDGYSWNRETFKDRKKYKNQDKVTICHKFNNNNEPAVTINVSSNAIKAHMNHGDVMGDCPSLQNNHFSNVFLTRRTAYYNILQNSQEQVLYSRSILDYALERLTNSRMQLVTLQNNNVPVAEIERKQVVVLQLEQNVSLLQTLVGVAANLLVNKLQ
jgi:preprotein translocase subunit SecG